MKKVILFSALAAVILLTGCSGGGNTSTPNTDSRNDNNSQSDVIINMPPETSGYDQRTQTTDEWKFRYNEKLGGIIIEECLCAQKRDGTRVYNAVDDIVVPSEFEGFEGVKVLEIGSNAFGNIECNSITLPDGILYIDKDAFAYSIINEPLVFPQSVIDMSEQALHCLYCDEVKLPPLETIPQNLFESSGVKRVVLPDSVTKIEEFAFSNCYITELICGDGLKEIGDNAFIHCWELENVTFNEGLETIGVAAFADSKKLSDNPIQLPDSLKEIKHSNGRDWAFSVDSSYNSPQLIYKGETYDYLEIIKILGSEP